jgi:hypothetical protein
LTEQRPRKQGFGQHATEPKANEQDVKNLQHGRRSAHHLHNHALCEVQRLEHFRHRYTACMLLHDRLIKEQHGRRACTHAALLAPHPELTSCVRAYVTRSTVGTMLSDDERLNHFPAAPTCAITWFMKGDYAHMHLGGELIKTPLPHPVMFTGPHTRSSVSINPGEVDTFILLILPDALHALTGLDIAAQVDRYSTPADVLDKDWQALTLKVLQAPDHVSRIQTIENFLLPRWQALGHKPTPKSNAFQHWTTGVADRAAHHAQGRSERQVDRRIKGWTGQQLRQLRGVGRAEDTLFRARDALAINQLHWAEIAADSGFADQAHLSREFRRITGLSPRQLEQVLTHESYWMYQIWA